MMRESNILPMRSRLQRRRNAMGQLDPGTIAAIGGALGGSGGGGSGLPFGGGSGGGGGGAGGDTTAVTVSPTMQQQFSPQFSPVMQMSSGSAPQSASIRQTTGGEMSAQGGSTAQSPTSPLPPGMGSPIPSPSYANYSPSAPTLPGPGWSSERVETTNADMIKAQSIKNLMMWVPVALIAVAAIFWFTKPKAKK